MGAGGGNDDAGVALVWRCCGGQSGRDRPFQCSLGFTHREPSRLPPRPSLTCGPATAVRPAWVVLSSQGPNPLFPARQTPPAPPPPASSGLPVAPGFCLPRGSPWGDGGAVGAGGSLPTGDRETETKTAKYHCTAKAAPSPAEPLTRSLGDYPRPEQPRGRGGRPPRPVTERPGDGAGGRRRAELPGGGGGWRPVCGENGSASGETVIGTGAGREDRRGLRLSPFGDRRGQAARSAPASPSPFAGGGKFVPAGGAAGRGGGGDRSSALRRDRAPGARGADTGVPEGGPGLGARGSGQAGCRGWEQAGKRGGVVSVAPHGWAQLYPGL